MDKNTTLASLKALVIKGEITRHDVDAVFHESNVDRGIKNINFSQVLYYIGAAIVLIGIFVLVANRWDEFNFFTKLLVTLGSGIAAYIVAVVFDHSVKTKQISPAFFFLSAILIPMGLGVLFDNAGYKLDEASVQLTISLILTALFAISYYVYKKNIQLFFVIAFATWAFFALTNLIIDGNPLAREWHIYTYVAMIIGLSYIAIGYSFQKSARAGLTGVLYFFGILGFLGAAITLNGFWEVIYAGLALGVLLLSTQLKSRSMLVFGALFLMGYLVKITGKYFSDSLGWAFALVLAGLMLIGVGYFTFYLNQKYLSKDATVRS
jgi:hypothetical protein